MTRRGGGVPVQGVAIDRDSRPAGELWHLVLQAWCELKSVTAVEARVTEAYAGPAEDVSPAVKGLMNGSIKVLPTELAEAFEQALSGAGKGGDVARPAAAQVADPEPVEEEPEALPAPPAAGAQEAREWPQRRYPFPCEEEGCDQGFETAQALGMHRFRAHGIAAQHRRPPAKATNLAELEARLRPEDPETEAIAVCARHLGRLTLPEAKRVLDYLASRFVVDAVDRPVSHLAALSSAEGR